MFKKHQKIPTRPTQWSNALQTLNYPRAMMTALCALNCSSPLPFRASQIEDSSVYSIDTANEFDDEADALTNEEIEQYRQDATLVDSSGAKAHYKLGWFYEHGQTGKQDLKRAKKHYEKASTFESKPGYQALYRLGLLHHRYLEDYSQAKVYYEKVADQAPWACYQLGELYRLGLGVTQDGCRARDYYKKAAASVGECGAKAYIQMGTLYEMGLGVTQNFEKAEQYYQKATIFVGEVACLAHLRIGELHHLRLDNYAVAKEHYKKASALEPWAAYQLGELYRLGRGVEKDYAKARKYYENVSEVEGEVGAWAHYQLACLYENGQGSLPSYQRAYQHYTTAATFPGAPGLAAHYHLGRLYQDGKGVEQDLKKAQKHYEKATSLDDAIGLAAHYQTGTLHHHFQNYSLARMHYEKSIGQEPWAYYQLGQLYQSGLGVMQDYQQASRYYKKAASFGGSLGGLANYQLGELYRLGLGVEKNYAQAKKYYEKAAAIKGKSRDLANARLQKLFKRIF